MTELPGIIPNTVMETLGINIVEFTKEKVVATMPVTSKTHQPYGLLHGGVSLVVAETVASAGSLLHIDKETQRPVGLEINANHLRSVGSGMVHAVGFPLHVGKKTLVWEIKIYDEEDNLLCASRCTIAVVSK